MYIQHLQIRVANISNANIQQISWTHMTHTQHILKDTLEHINHLLTLKLKFMVQLFRVAPLNIAVGSDAISKFAKFKSREFDVDGIGCALAGWVGMTSLEQG